MALLNKNSVSGVQEILVNLRKGKARIGLGLERGLKIAGLQLQRQSQQLVPVDFGPLKASAFTRAQGKRFQTSVGIGYTAAYALHVHELVAMKLKGQPRRAPSKGRYWDPQGRGQAKFLEEPFRRFGPTLKKIVTEEIQKA